MYPNTINSTHGSTDPTAAETPLQAESEKLNVSLNTLGVTAEALVYRLSQSVLRPEVVVQIATAGNTRASDLPPPRETMCNAAERLLAQRQRVDNITTQLQQALDRLEA